MTHRERMAILDFVASMILCGWLVWHGFAIADLRAQLAAVVKIVDAEQEAHRP